MNKSKLVRTSDGHLIPWDASHIVKSLQEEVTDISAEEAQNIASRVTSTVDKIDADCLSGALIRGLVETDMLTHGHRDWQREYARVGMPLADVKKIWKAVDENNHENANLDSLNPESMHKHAADRLSKEAVLHMLPPEIADLHMGGAIHIHDLEYFWTRPFCYDQDLRYIFYYGLMPDGRGINLPVARAAKEPEVAILHAAKALGCNQTVFSGGQGFQNFLCFLAPYFEGLPYPRIKQLMQMFVYELGQMMVARGGQVIFSSIQLMPGVPRIWRDKPVVYKGLVHDGKDDRPLRMYGEFEREVRLAFKACCEVYMEGDAWGKPFNFPKFELCLRPEFVDTKTWEVPLGAHEPVAPSYFHLLRMAFKLSAKYGTPYIDNQLPSSRNLENGISCFQCCAYSWSVNGDTDPYFEDKLHFRDGRHFDNFGSCQVVSLNLPRAAYVAEGNYERMIRYLYDLVDQAVKVFQIKRDVVRQQPLPFARQTPPDPQDQELKAPPLADIEGLSYVIGVIGLNELCQHYLGQQMHEDEAAWRLGLQVMADLKYYVQVQAKKYGMRLALARTPAETTAQRFAVADLLDPRYTKMAEKVVKGNLRAAMENLSRTRDLPVEYSNGTHLGVDAPVKLRRKIEIEQEFFDLVDGGNIFHIFIDDAFPLISAVESKTGDVPDCMVEELMDYIITLARSSRLSYIKVSKDLTICWTCRAVRPGLTSRCRACGSELVDHLALVTGYMAPLSSMNEAKREEIKQRRRYNIGKDMVKVVG